MYVKYTTETGLAKGGLPEAIKWLDLVIDDLESTEPKAENF